MDEIEWEKWMDEIEFTNGWNRMDEMRMDEIELDEMRMNELDETRMDEI